MREYTKDIHLNERQDAVEAIIAEFRPALARAVEGRVEDFYAGRVQVRYEIVVRLGKTTMRVTTEEG